MSHTIAEIAEAIGAQAFGDVNLRVCNAAEPAMAGPDDLALAMDRKYAPQLAGGRARAAMLWDGADWQPVVATRTPPAAWCRAAALCHGGSDTDAR